MSARRETVEYDAQGTPVYLDGYENGEMIFSHSFEYYDENYFASITSYGREFKVRQEWKYGTDGKPKAYYHYENDEFIGYVSFYSNIFSDPGSSVEPVSGSVATRVWGSGGSCTSQPWLPVRRRSTPWPGS
ncbi:MAG: hypothetical protein LBR86_08105 [Tannerella sp.]|jgi:hypothetical protein|nr:hypothetical protein [Tannerella sp.]